MKRGDQSIKKRIKRRIEIKQGVSQKKITKMGIRDIIRTTGTPPKPISVDLVSRNDVRNGITPTKTFPPYQKKAFVDYDVVICIPSNERYEKVKRLIGQFYEQPTQYAFKIILLNDGSKDLSYDTLIEDFPEITYLKNEKANGKTLHWYCYNQMWEHLKNIECYVVLQMDDDFILSDNFLNTIIDLFFDSKEKDSGIMAIAPHLWSFKRESDFETWWKSNSFVDGIALIDYRIIRDMNYQMEPVDADAVSKRGVPVRAWIQISEQIRKMGGVIHRTPNSLVFHDGNEDSKLHGDVRGNGKGVFTQKYKGKL